MTNKVLKFIGWSAVSSGAQTAEDKISPAEQCCANLLAARRHGGVMVCQLVVLGVSRSITLFEDAARTVQGVVLRDTFDALTGDSLLRAIDSRLRELSEQDDRVLVYDELKRLIDERALDVFVFRNLGRVGRTAALQITAMSLCDNAGILTYSTATPPPSLMDAGATYHKSLIDAITAVGYENEVHEIKRRHEMGIKRRVEGGRMPGRVPFGYRAVRNDRGVITGYEIVDDEADVVRLIVRLYLDEQLGTPAICEHLNEAGTRAPGGGQWMRNSVLVILKRADIYAGINSVNRKSKQRPLIKAAGRWSPIIDEPTLQRIKAEFKARKHFGRSAYHVHRYSRMVFCTCGARCRVQNTTMKRTRADGSQWSKRLTRYQCNEHGGVAEWKITEAVRAFILFVPTVAGYVEPEPEPSRAAEIMAEIEKIDQQIESVEDGIAKADADYYLNKLSEKRHTAIVAAGNQRMETLLARRTVLQDELHAEEVAELSAERLDEIRNDGIAMLEHPDARHANAWLRHRLRVTIRGSTIVDVRAI